MKSFPVSPSSYTALSAILASLFWTSGVQAKPTYITIDAPHAYRGDHGGTVAQSVNRKGQVAGYFFVQSPVYTKCFLRNADGSYIEFAPHGTIKAYVSRIDDNGEIAGFYSRKGSSDQAHGFIRSADGTLTTFDAPEATSTMVMDMNQRGTIVGWSNGPRYYGFIRTRDGRFISATPSGALGAVAYGINNSGQVAGAYYTSGQSQHFFIRGRDGTFTEFNMHLPTNGSGEVLAAGGFDEAGDIAGWYLDPYGTNQSFVRKADGTIISLDPYNANGTLVNGFNQRGVAVGSYTTNPPHSHALSFLQGPDGISRKIKPPIGWQKIVAYGLSPDGGSVVGSYSNTQGGEHGFLRVEPLTEKRQSNANRN